MIIKFYLGDTFQGECKPKCFTFPDGQPHISLSVFKEDIKDSFQYRKDFDRVEVDCSIRNPADLFNLGLVLDVINLNLPHRTSADPIIVNIYWLFGARMDRRIDNCQPNTSDIVVQTLDMYQDFYNCKYKALDVHNAAIFEKGNGRFPENKVGGIPIWGIFGKAYVDFYGQVSFLYSRLQLCPDIYFPDKGAKERYSSGDQLKNTNVLFGRKKRDPNTGKLSGFEFESGDKKSNSVIVLDDICDGAYTFIGHLEILKQMGYKHIALYTTHGIYSKGMAVLDNFDAVYSTNSFVLGGILDDDGYPMDNYLRLRKWSRESNIWDDLT